MGSDGVVYSINNSSGNAMQRSYSNGWTSLVLKQSMAPTKSAWKH